MDCYSFNAVPMGAPFTCNGTAYIKKSTRTARHAEYGSLHYFRTGELCYGDFKSVNPNCQPVTTGGN